MSSQKCPRCGRDVALDAPGGLCAACLLEAGAETFSSGSGSTDFMPTVSSAAAPATTRLAPRLREGERWGSYQIGRLLGRGGMGEVFVALPRSAGDLDSEESVRTPGGPGRSTAGAASDPPAAKSSSGADISSMSCFVIPGGGCVVGLLSAV